MSSEVHSSDGPRRNGQITTAECEAMRILARDGWGTGVLRMTFHLSRSTYVNNHVKGECEHDSRIPPVEDPPRNSRQGYR